MAAIVEVNGNRRLQLGNEEIVRQFNFGPRWTKLRIVITMGFNGTQSFNGRLMMGVCQGNNGFTAPVTDAGVWLCPISFATDPGWTYTPNTPAFNNGSGNKRGVTRIGTTITDTNSGSSAYGWAAAPFNLAQWSVLFTRRVSSTVMAWNGISLEQAVPSATQQQQTIVDFNYYRSLENEGGANFYGLQNDDAAMYWNFAAPGPVWDTFTFHYNRSTPTVEIGHIAAIRYV